MSRYWGLLVLLLVGLTYAGAFSVPYLWDDHLLIAGLGGFDSSLGERLSAAWGPFLGIYFRPLPLTLIALEMSAGTSASWVSHGVSLGIFLGIVFFLMSWLRAEQLSWRSATLAGAVFGTLPLASEAVLWTSARGDLLVVLFGLAALRTTARRFPMHLSRRASPPVDGRQGILSMVGFVLLALLSKETGVAVAVAVATRSFWPTFLGQGKFGGRSIWVLVPILLAALYLAVRSVVLPALPPPELASPQGLESVSLVLATLGTMMRHLLWPFAPDLAIGSRVVPLRGDPTPLFGLGLVLGLSLLVLQARFGVGKRLGLAAALLGLFLLPVSNLIPIEIATRTADRYLVLPFVAVSFFLACGLETVSRGARGRLIAGIAALGCVGLVLVAALGTWNRVHDWQGEERFLRTLHAEADSGNGQPALVLGAWLAQRSRCEEAVPILRDAVVLLKAEGRERSEAQARGGLADCLPQLGLMSEGLRHARRSAVLDPSLPGAQERILRTMRLAGLLDDAIREGKLALQLFPSDPSLPAELSRSYAAELQFKEALSALEEARRRAGLTGGSALVQRMASAEDSVAAARSKIESDDLAGYEELARLAEEWGNPEKARELREISQLEADSP